jgi:hypothetical protein
MPRKLVIAVIVAALVVGATIGPSVASTTTSEESDDAQLDENIDSMEEAVLFARNVREVKGHLRASVRLAGDFQLSEAEFHAEHAYTDYWAEGSLRGPIGPAIADANPSLANELETKLQALESDSTSLSSAEYERVVIEEVFPLLNQALHETIPAEYREGPRFDTRVTKALLDRIDDEYTGGISPSETAQSLDQYRGGTVQGIDGYREYWDARGFIVEAGIYYSEEVAPTLDREDRRAAAQSFAELQAVASLQASPSALTSITDELRSQLPETDDEATETSTSTT